MLMTWQEIAANSLCYIIGKMGLKGLLITSFLYFLYKSPPKSVTLFLVELGC
jgi:hypothetical protein